MQKSPWWPLRPTYGYGVKGQKKRQRQGPCHRDDTAISSSFLLLSQFSAYKVQHVFFVNRFLTSYLVFNNPFFFSTSIHVLHWPTFGVKGHVGVFRGSKRSSSSSINDFYGYIILNYGHDWLIPYLKSSTQPCTSSCAWIMSIMTSLMRSQGQMSKVRGVRKGHFSKINATPST